MKKQCFQLIVMRVIVRKIDLLIKNQEVIGVLSNLSKIRSVGEKYTFFWSNLISLN